MHPRPLDLSWRGHIGRTHGGTGRARILERRGVLVMAREATSTRMPLELF